MRPSPRAVVSLLLLLLFLLAAGCADEPPDPPAAPADELPALASWPAGLQATSATNGPAATATAAAAPAAAALLQGNTCAARACPAGACGMIDDGCRAQMWCGECACATGVSTCERSLSQIWEQPLYGPGTFTIVATTVSPSTIDAVMHVIDDAGHEVAFDDNSAGGTLPRLTVTIPAGQQRLLVVRPKDDSVNGGFAILQINGQGTLVGVKGRKHVFTNLRANEEIESVQLPSSTAVHILYAMSPDEQHIQARVRGNGTAGGALFTQPTAASRRVFWIGSEQPGPQLARLLRNDRRLSGHDLDGDQLGSELEAVLGTCAALSGYASKDGTSFDCALASDARDTDGDGLADGLEVRGARATTPHQPLPRWGADPRHKDLFAEVDSSQLTTGEVAPRLTAAQARMFSDIYGDRLRALTPFESLLHAALLGNPDARPGIATHLDIGRPPESAGDATIYGDWGGNSVVPPQQNGVGAYPGTAWRSHLAASRVAIFRYALLWNGTGGNTSTSDTCPGCGSYAWGSSNENGDPLSDTPAHESGHANGIAHSGPAGVDPEIDPNCKPGWPSVMNYAFAGAGTGFSDGLGLRTVNNARAVEWNAVSPSMTGVIAVLRDAFQYRVDPAGHVDWNRDGVFAPASATVRAYINNRPGHGGCEFTRYNSQLLPTQLSTLRSPALARLEGRMFLLAPGQNQLRVTSSTSSFDCPLSTAACGAFGSVFTTALDASRGVDAARVTSAGGDEALLVIGIDATGVANYQLVTRSVLGAYVWSAPQWAGLWGTTTGEPAVETLPDGRALLVLRQPSGIVLYAVFQYDGGGAGAFLHGGDALQCGTGAPLQQKATASPGLARVAFNATGPRTWLLLNSPSTGFTLKSFDDAALCFRDAEVPLDATGWDPTGRPVGVWVADASNALGGKLHILGADFNSDPIYQHLTQLWSYADPVTGALRVGLGSGFDSIWARGYGLDAWHDPQDGNLRALWSMSPTLGAGKGQLMFYPRADGINDFPQINYDDWSVLRWAVCKNLVNPTGSVSSPIACPPRPTF